jgi:hypothetical protein
MSLDAYVGVELEWNQPKTMRRFFTLTSGDAQIATLQFESMSRATGECDGGKWTFKRVGFFSPKATVRVAGSETDLARFAPAWMGSGAVAFAAGPQYQLRPSNFWHTEWNLEAADGRIVQTLSGRPHLMKQGGVASLKEAGLAEAPVLLLLMWYVRVLAHDDEAAAVVAGT